MSNEWSAYRLLFEADRKTNEARFDSIDETLQEIQETLSELKAQRSAINWASNFAIPGIVAVAASWATRKLGLLLVLLLLFPQLASAADVTPDTSHIIPVIGLTSLGQVCPVAPNLAMTAAHVVDPRPFSPDSPMLAYRAGDGFAYPIKASLREDLAFMELSFETEAYEVARRAPEVGERLYWVGYDFRKRKDALKVRQFSGEVIRIVSGNIVIDAETVQGSSGSCLLNGAGQVVGIVVWSFEAGAGSDSVTVGVATFGDWYEDAKQRLGKKDKEE